MKNKIKFIPILLILLAVMFPSCESWLDVSPKSQVKDSELFSSQAGFKEALAGVYSGLVSTSLYTREMRYGMIGVLAHEWSNFSGTTYPEADAYDYTVNNPKGRIKNIWEGMYNAIANANVILEVIDDNKMLFTGNNYHIIKGEALALRAFIHFDLLRCFGVSYAVDKTKPSIPYVTLYAPGQTKQLTVDEVALAVLDDLKAAAELLKAADPIHTGRTITEFDDNGYLMNRQLHLNYYAVKGLMARVYLWMGEYGDAAECAEEVIGSGAFDFVAQNHMINNLDPAGAVEQLWGIDVNHLYDIYFEYFTDGGQYSLSTTDLEYYYDNKAIDYRYLYLFSQYKEYDDIRITKKFAQPNTSMEVTNAAYYQDKMSMIKLSEMYLILAESRYRTTGDWQTPIKDLYAARGVAFEGTSLSDDVLLFEYRKEFIAEGQLWFLYKRLNRTNIYGIDVDLVSLKAYTFPLPDSELQAADRKDNR